MSESKEGHNRQRLRRQHHQQGQQLDHQSEEVITTSTAMDSCRLIATSHCSDSSILDAPSPSITSFGSSDCPTRASPFTTTSRRCHRRRHHSWWSPYLRNTSSLFTTSRISTMFLLIMLATSVLANSDAKSGMFHIFFKF